MRPDQARHIAAGLCGKGCGRAIAPGLKTLCRECADKTRVRMPALRAAKGAAGLCVDGCGRPLAPGLKSRCRECADKTAASTSRYKEAQRAAGLCSAGCGRPLIVKHYCRAHTFKRTLRAAKIPHALEHALLAMLDAQGRRCAYTGAQIDIGQGASLDHRIPKSKGGTHDLSNLQWVHTNVNKAKLNLSEDDFIAMCELVTRHARAKRLAARALRKCFAGAAPENDDASDSNSSEQQKAVGQ